MSGIDVFAPAEAVLGEGPSWDASNERLLWTDIVGHRMFVWERGSVRTFDLGDYVSAAFATPSPERVAVALGTGVSILHLGSGAVAPLADTGADPQRVRVNDAKVDPHGRLWLGTMAIDEKPGEGSLYRLDRNGAFDLTLAGISVSNGPAFASDGRTMFYVDSPTRQIVRFEVDADGGLGPRAVLTDTSAWPGLPDGMTVDADDNLWVAFWDGACVRCLSPTDGSLLAVIELPVSRPTSCVFGGPALDRLLITSARIGLSAEELRDQPQAGSVLSADVGVTGSTSPPLTP